MDRKKEISDDIWEIMRQVYEINVNAEKSTKQEVFIGRVVEYIDATTSTRHKKVEGKDKIC